MNLRRKIWDLYRKSVNVGLKKEDFDNLSKGKKIWFTYQLSKFFEGAAMQEYSAIINFVNPATLGIWLLVFKSFGLLKVWWLLIIFEVIRKILFILIGIFLVDKGSVKYQASVSNSQNPELQEILSFIRKQNGQ